MKQGQVRRAARLGMLAATVALGALLGIGAASATGLPSVGQDQAGSRQTEASESPGSSSEASGPMDVDLAEVGFRDLPIAVEAGEGLAVRVRAPDGATCSGWIAYSYGPWQSLDEAGAHVGACAWDVTVPVGTRPGSLVLAADIGRGGEGRNIFGVVYVSTRTVGDISGGRDRRDKIAT